MLTIPTYNQEKLKQISIGEEPQGNWVGNPSAPCDTPSETSSQDGSNDVDSIGAELRTPFRQWIDSETFVQLKENPGIEATPRLLIKAQNLSDTDDFTSSTTLDGHGDPEEQHLEEYIPKCVLSSPDLPLLDQHGQYSMTESDFQRFNDVLVRRIREMEEFQKGQMADMQRKLDDLRRELREKDTEMLLLEERNEVLETTLEKIMVGLQHMVTPTSMINLEKNTVDDPHHSGLDANFTHSPRLSPKPRPSPRLEKDASI